MKRWDDLSYGEQRRVLDKYRYINVEYSWWEDVIEVFREDMKGYGIEVGDAYFDYSEAAFEGSITDWVLFLTHLKYDDDWLLNHFSDHASFKVHIDHRSRYPMMEAEAELPLPDDPDFLYQYGTGEEFRDAALIAALSQYDPRELRKEFLSAFKDYARNLARMLDEEYEYRLSDEGVLEALKDCDMLEGAILEVLGDEEEEEVEE